MARFSFVAGCLTLTMLAPPVAGLTMVEVSASAPWRAAANEASGAHGRLYRDGQRALDAGKWKEAAEIFARVAAAKGADADAALYWQAYAATKQGNDGEALGALRTLRSEHPKSGWLDDAQALELEMRGPRGAAVAESEAEKEELALYALNSLLHTDSARAVAMLQKFLQEKRSPKLQEKALFVLSQSGAPAARQLLLEIARGRTSPGLQLEAIQMLGIASDQPSIAALGDIYRGSANREVKQAVLRAYLVADAEGELLAVARGERDAELRGIAIRELGAIGAGEELRQLFAAERDEELRHAILRSMGVASDVEGLLQVARSSSIVEMRHAAIAALGIVGDRQAGPPLLQLYRETADLGTREAVVDALFVQDNARGLVELFRVEKDARLRRAIVRKLSLMDSAEATELMHKLLEQ